MRFFFRVKRSARYFQTFPIPYFLGCCAGTTGSQGGEQRGQRFQSSARDNGPGLVRLEGCEREVEVEAN